MITLTGLTKTVVDGRRRIPILDNIHLSIDKGEFVSVIGPSGSGKSTLLNILGLLDRPAAGDYSFAGESVLRLSAGRLAAFRNRRIGFVFQLFMLLPRMSVLDNTGLPLLYSSIPRRERRRRCSEALEQVGMLEKARQRAIHLSGGEKQRVAIARALVNNPELILADEPTGNLDDDAKRDILGIFSQLRRQGRTIVMVTHDTESARIADRCLRIQGGRISAYDFGGSPAAVGPVTTAGLADSPSAAAPVATVAAPGSQAATGLAADPAKTLGSALATAPASSPLAQIHAASSAPADERETLS